MTDSRWSADTRRWVVVGLVVGGALALYAIRAILPALILSLLLAYLINPLVNGLQHRGVKARVLAAALVYLALILFVAAIFIALVPRLLVQIRTLTNDLDASLEQLSAALHLLPLIDALGVRVDSPSIMNQLRAELSVLARNAPALLAGAFSGVLSAMVMLVLSFYLVKDADTIARALDNALPDQHRDEARRIKAELERIWSNFLRGQVVLALIIGVVTGAAMTLLGVPNAILLGLIAGLLEVVPTIGPIIAAIPGVLIAFFQGSTYLTLDHGAFALIVVLAYVLIQQLENNLIVPHVLGSSVDLPPYVILVGALAGASIAGVLGVFLAAPVLATLRLVLQLILRNLLAPDSPSNGATPQSSR